MRPRAFGPAALLAVALSAPFRPLAAQTSEMEVEATVRRLFDAMRAGDGAQAAAVFHADAQLNSVGEQDGRVVVATDEAAAFVEAVGAPRSEVWDERISNLEIRVDADLATAWMDYSFYLDDRFSHCGVNAFQLVRTDGTWKILQITDTRRREGCG